MFINIKILSKNKMSLQRFLKFFVLFCNENKINFFIKYFSQKQKIHKFTILKSPHVNKKAQEQFEYRLFSKKLNIFSFQILKFIIVLKKIQLKLFSDIKINIKFILNTIKLKKQISNSLKPNNFKLKTFQNTNYNSKIKSYLKLLDLYGEMSLQLSE
jgi:ribosomal protein S10